MTGGRCVARAGGPRLGPSRAPNDTLLGPSPGSRSHDTRLQKRATVTSPRSPAAPGPERRPRRGASRAARFALAAASVLATLLAAEGVLRFVYRPRGALVPGVQWPSGTLPTTSRYERDPELGYRPRLGNDVYTRFGTRVNEYSEEKTPGVPRLLLMGDSVTYRGALEVALRQSCGEAVEVWNAGVEGYNAIQEVGYYLRWNRAVHPDHVVLTFHNNDFQATPVVMAGEGDELAVILPDRPVEGWRPGLLSHSRLYRLWFDWRLRRQRPFDLESLAARTESALRDLQGALAEDGSRLTVLLLPILSPLEEWTDEELASRRRSLEMAERLGVETYDLWTPVEMAMAAGVELRSDAADSWHPNQRAGHILTGWLLRQGFLSGTLDTARECKAPSAWKKLRRRTRREARSASGGAGQAGRRSRGD